MTSYHFGIEEEFFLVKAVSGEACAEMPPSFWRAVKQRVPTISKELLQSQLEIQTTPCTTSQQALDQLSGMRRDIAEVAREHGIAIAACGTHPTFDWRDARQSKGERYSKVVRDVRMLAFRNLFCGLHIHAEVPESASRVALMNRCVPYLPLFLALSVSSPFWRSGWTGMHGYRLTGYDELPRTGMPPVFADEAGFETFVATLARAGLIADSSYIWWAIRPAKLYPTLELRICDSTNDLRDVLAIASLFRALVHRLVIDPDFGPKPEPLIRALADENRWQVQCDGPAATIVDLDTMEPTTARQAINQLVDTLARDAEALGCLAEMQHATVTAANATSADKQLVIYRNALSDGSSEEHALGEVIQWLAETTAQGVPDAACAVS